eukprot:comp7941_c0_seq1/m.8286 comp7941_c0_seq1/g.8286  ORF comp7941_c0_seq1/g.8286 comp7941_c0_seq1/m.8286 type:complete len:342 (+) comp7941_c0_seq1:175-1200(+)
MHLMQSAPRPAAQSQTPGSCSTPRQQQQLLHPQEPALSLARPPQRPRLQQQQDLSLARPPRPRQHPRPPQERDSCLPRPQPLHQRHRSRPQQDSCLASPRPSRRRRQCSSRRLLLCQFPVEAEPEAAPRSRARSSSRRSSFFAPLHRRRPRPLRRPKRPCRRRRVVRARRSRFRPPHCRSLCRTGTRPVRCLCLARASARRWVSARTRSRLSAHRSSRSSRKVLCVLPRARCTMPPSTRTAACGPGDATTTRLLGAATLSLCLDLSTSRTRMSRLCRLRAATATVRSCRSTAVCLRAESTRTPTATWALRSTPRSSPSPCRWPRSRATSSRARRPCRSPRA